MKIKRTKRHGWRAKSSQATARTVRRVLILAVGLTLLVIGAALLLLPGPGLAVIGGGLALLATEFVWARVWMKRLLDKVNDVTETAQDLFRNDKKGE